MNYFELELDTTAPKIEVYAPSYTTPEIDNEIRVVSNEKLADYQEIYFVDSRGIRHDLIFLYNGDEFVGQVRFNNLSLGIGVLYVRVVDTVFNPSEVVSKAINIMGTDLEITATSQGIRPIKTYHNTLTDITVDRTVARLSADTKIMDVTTTNMVASLKVSLEVKE